MLLSLRPLAQFRQPFARTFYSSIRRTMATEFKLKGLTSIDLKNGDKKEVEIEGIEEGKVLLVKINDSVHAVGSKCTHYGAPLAKGVLTADGRLTCPWHGACFNVKTGDVEDAPAIDPIARFDVFQKEGGVYIRGEEKVIKAARRQPNLRCKPKEQQESVVIVGRGAAALGAMEALREHGFDGKITTISDEKYPPVDRTKISKALLADVSKAQWRTPDFYEDAGIALENGFVEKVDFDAKKVKTKEGKEYKYSKLILASGGLPKMLPLDGLKGDLQNVFVLRNLEHAQAVLDAAGEEGGKKIVVVGSSFIGMEVGNCLAGKKHDVTIIGMESEPMERVMGKELGKIFKSLVEKAGVKFIMDASVEKGVPGKSDPKKIGAVQLKDGSKIEADLVIEGVGVRPSTDYLKETSVQLEKDGSIPVDERWAVKGLKDVYAIGDIATFPYYGPGGNGKPVRIEHWDVAQNAGRSVAETITKPNSTPRTNIPIFWSAMGAQLRYCGHTPEGYDDVLIHGNTDTSEGKQSFVAYYCKGDEVVAVASMAKDPWVVQSAELMRAGKMPTKSELQKGVDPTELSVPAKL